MKEDRTMQHVRYEMRRAVNVPVELVCSDWDEPVVLTTADLSPQGCFLPSALLVDQGTPVVVSFRLGEDGVEWSFFGEVARVSSWRRRTDPFARGMGVRFVGTRPWERLRLRSRLRGVPPPLPRRGPPRLPGYSAARA
jgi:hypothetical protein